METLETIQEIFSTMILIHLVFFGNLHRELIIFHYKVMMISKVRNIMYTFFSIVLWLILGTICSRVARHRGRNPTLWFFLGVVLGVIGLLILYIMPSKKAAVATAPATASIRNEEPIEISVSPTDPAPPAESTILWYYLDNENKQYGPMSFTALQGAWDDDQITSSTYVWNEKMENWQTLEELPDLLAQIRRTPQQ